MRSPLIAAAVLALLAASCVKEERTDCPCFLTLDLDKVISDSDYSEAVATLGPCTDRTIDQKRIALMDYEGVGYEKKVPKETVRISVVCGFKNGNFRDDCYLVPENQQSDPIMAFAESRRCSRERESAEVELHKQYCRIKFKFLGIGEDEEIPYDLRIRADCNGIGLYDLQPIEGAYTATALKSNSGELTMILPRQKSGAVALDLVDAGGDVVHVMDVGARMDLLGYDWTKADLDDVSIEIDFCSATMNVGILPWDINYDYETIDI